MAYFTESGKGWRAQVAINGFRKSKTFRTKREATAWAGALETEVRERERKPAGERYTLANILSRYLIEVVPGKRGARWEALRIQAFLRSSLPVNKPICEVDPNDFASWRDERKKVVKPGTILRDFSLLSSILEHARREWRVIQTNPVSDVSKPSEPRHRDATYTRPQIKAILQALDYQPSGPVNTNKQAIGVAFLLAMRTGMRAGELCGLEWPSVHHGWCRVEGGKTEAARRDVPLTAKALRLVERLRGRHPVKVLNLQSRTLDTQFRRARDQAGVGGMVFHDTRHTAATWIAPRLDVLTLCKMFGWKNPSQAMTYYNPKAADIAKRIA